MNIRIGFFGLFLTLTFMLFLSSGLYAQERTHTVQRGETFYSIARSFGIKADDLMRHNGISDPSRLLAGQRLRIPSSTPAQGVSTTYRVVRGDTLFSIARRFSVSVASIQQANNLSANHVLREGATLRIPGAVTPAASAAVSPSSSPAASTAAPAAARTQTANLISSVRWPVNARELSYMTGKLEGVVITGARSEAVSSLTRGTVLSAGPYRGFGRVVIVQVDGGYLYVYGGLESLSVKEGDRVGPGTEIGKLGIDAAANKPQLFFMAYRNNVPIDPAKAPRA